MSRNRTLSQLPAGLAADSSNRIYINTSSSQNAQLFIKNSNAAYGALQLQAASGQSPFVLEIFNSSGTSVFGVNLAGGVQANGGRAIPATNGGFILSESGLNTDIVTQGRVAGITGGWGSLRVHQTASYPGLMLIGDTSQTADYFYVGTGAGTSVLEITSAGYLLVGYGSSNGAYRLQVNSQIFATSSSIATSDGRYKENVAELTGGLAMIKSLRPVSFSWKQQEDVVIDNKVVREAHNFPPGKTIGFIAQEVQEALKDNEWISNLVKSNERAAVKDEQGNEILPAEEFLGIAETNLTAILVSAVKELGLELERMKANS